MDTTNRIWTKISNEKRDVKIRSMLKNYYSSHKDEVIPTKPSNPFNDKNEEIEEGCNHKDKDGNFTLKDNHDGTFTCSICKQTFRMVYAKDLIREKIDRDMDFYHFMNDLQIDTYYGK